MGETIFSKFIQNISGANKEQEPTVNLTANENTIGTQQLYATPLDYGAVGDGVSDDTDSIQACVNANAIVRFPAGYVFRITKPIEIKNTDTCLLGDNALYQIHHASISGVDDTTARYRLANMKKAMSIIYVDFNKSHSDEYAIVVYKHGELTDAKGNAIGALRFSIHDLMIYGNRYTSRVESTPSGTIVEETRDAIHIGGIDAHTGCNITRCGFVGLSGTAVSIRSQHSEVSDLSFYSCYTCIKHDSFDHIFKNIWACKCHDGFVGEYVGYNQKFKFDNIWFDQAVGDCIRFTRMQTVLISNCWCDLIGGRFLAMPMSAKNNGEELRGFIIGTRINRSNQISGGASIEAASTSQFYAQISSEEAKYNKLVLKPMFKFSGSCNNSILIVPGRTQVLSSNGQRGNFVFGASGV